MLKKITSLIGGIVLGIIISYFTLDYNGWTIYEMDGKGNTVNTTNELDFDLLTNSFLIILGCTLLIYISWTLVEKYRNK
ncbi:hypothetical protein C1N70_27410 (plasmid) [Cytobacillus firmus]|uniref:Uncharacterized protein n=1 Tax=Cytobacillus oceanisediminis TaxID=665099 RepID=A0ABX3CNI7_9BACI|nr:hypothetical protein BBV17_25610 [Cytobacillus oceanisediminis]